MSSILDMVSALPKAELHMHIEGSLEPDMMLRLARKNAVALPWQEPGELRNAYRFSNLQDFLNVYYRGLTVMVGEEDFYDVTLSYLRCAHGDNVVHAELFVSPQAHLHRGIAMETMMHGVLRACAAARAEFGMTVALILLFQRHHSEDDAFHVFDLAEPWQDDVIGFGLGGAEIGNPPAKFQRIFARCRDAGYKVVAHAGEEGPAEYVREAIDLLKVDRIDHGVRAADDPELVRRLAAEQIPLTVCPLSNVRLGVFPSMAAHNMRDLLQAGVMVTVNSDDPPYFGGYINDNLRQCVDALALSRQQAMTLLQNSFKAAFMPEEQKSSHLAQLQSERAD